MIYVVYALVAVLGTAVHLWRHPADRDAGRAVEVALIWWIVVTIGIAGIVGAGFHLFDGPAIAKEIGFTRGDGGFQTEVGFGDLAPSSTPTSSSPSLRSASTPLASGYGLATRAVDPTFMPFQGSSRPV